MVQDTETSSVTETSSAPFSIANSNLPLEAKLERARIELLDLSARNRLLNIPRSSRTVRTIEIVDERSTEVFRLLARENRAFTFLAGRASTSEGAPETEGDSEEIVALAQPEDDSVDARGVLNRHADTKLQTRLTSQGLQKRLLDLYADARTLEEEQGVNILYLALGTLKWIDPANAKNIRYAPLILVPVSLERTSAADRFKLKWRQEEIASNLSLEAYLDRVHALKLPSFDASEDFDPAAYMAAVAATVSSKEGWSVSPDDIILGFFSFAKFLMYRDLDPELWPKEGKLTELPLIRSLLAEGFAHRENMIPEDAHIDAFIPPSEMRHIVDSDSSQSLAIHDVRCGHNLVIQGPPGTGKSQTIANIIAAAIADGKTVLFVAEKMAALEVVKRRLDHAGVGDACLELHSNKANKRSVLEELRRTWELGSPKGNSPDGLTSRLQDARDCLNEHADRMHRFHPPSGLSPYQVIGELVRLRKERVPPTDFELEGAEQWSPQGLSERRKLLNELLQRMAEIGRPAIHPWYCVDLESVLPPQVDRITRRIAELKSRLEEIASQQSNVAQILELPPPASLRAFDKSVEMAQRLGTTPAGLEEALGCEEWDRSRSQIDKVLKAGASHAQLTAELSGRLRPAGWTTDVTDVRRTMENLPTGFDAEAFARAQRLHILLPQLKAAAEQSRQLLGLAGDSETATAVQRTLEIGTYVAAAPAASPETFTAAVWDYGVELAGTLVEAVAGLQDAQNRIGNRLVAAAWENDCVAIRRVLASYGASFFRYLSGEWRRANRLVKSLLQVRETSLNETISLLDMLMEGQRARAAVRDGDALGRSAFGPQWRGERSSAQELRALLEWMRSLGPWAKDIRSIASRTQDQAAIGVSVACLKAIWDEARSLLEAFQRDIDGSDADQLAPTLERCTEISRAEGICREVFVEVPPMLAGKLSLFDNTIAHQSATKAITEADELGRACFGSLWAGTKSCWPGLERAAEWIDRNGDIRRLAARVSERGELASRAAATASAADAFTRAAETLFGDLQLDKPALFGTGDIRDLSAERLAARFDTWLTNPEELSKWVTYRERAQRGRTLGLRELIERLEDGRSALGEAESIFELAYYEAVLKTQVRREPALGQFDGEIHSRRTQEFAELDLRRMAAACLETVTSHHRRIPRSGGGIGPLGVLRTEIAKRRGHMPIRQLMMKAAPAIQALKPVLMMSPLSVAQFLPPGQLTFDMLVMDEASQIQPVDALGAVARCRQVGDERQLPPTRFFSKMTGDQTDCDEDGESAQVADIESILGLFTARGLPHRMLRWHYRSRHQSLIAISNTQFYENKLFIVPSPYTSEAGMGLCFHHVRDGRFDSGNSRVNAIEAKTVAEAVIRHAMEHPELSLGVATFSASQRRAIRDQVELLRRVNPGAESFFQSHANEPFFIKNLENVQGDERDVIFISVGYGKNAQGYMAMAFGPLSAEGGERRLNVLISRAKQRCEVYASITDEDIDLERGKGKGVFAFKLFLQFARTGRLSMAEASGRDHDSVFEIQVANALVERGYQVHPQVGIAGFFIDLAIADPERPGRYVLGIECDGAAYHNARSARDRDRLRQSVLEEHGWILHRIWSTDWFQRPKEQLERTVAAIEAAKAELEARGERTPSSTAVPIVPVGMVTIDRDDANEIEEVDGRDAQSGSPYVEASPERPRSWPELHETSAVLLSQMVAEVVATEGPVHVEEVVARIRSAWNLQRSGSRIQAIVEQAITVATQSSQVKLEGRFLSVPDGVIRVRDRTRVISSNLRKPEMLPPAEMKAGVLQVVRANLGGSQDQVIGSVLRLLGFGSSSAHLRHVVQLAINDLIEEGFLERQGEYLVATEVEAER